MSPMLPDLPVEIISLISEFSSIAAVVALSRTNRRIHSICFRYIYRAVELEDSARAVKWSTTLATNIPYAQEVRKLKLCVSRFPFFKIPLKWFASLCHISCEHSRRRFNTTFHSALSNLKNLENLHLSTPHLGILPCFSDVHFPKLRICSLPLSLYTDPFVRRHQGLISLYVLPEQYHMQISSTPPDISAAEIRLPNLRTFIGPETFAFKVVPHSSASRISVMWNTRRLLLCDLSSDIATLALSRTEILTLDNIVGIWDTSLLSAIVAGLPHLLKLGFWNVSVPNSDSQNVRHLPRFPCYPHTDRTPDIRFPPRRCCCESPRPHLALSAAKPPPRPRSSKSARSGRGIRHSAPMGKHRSHAALRSPPQRNGLGACPRARQRVVPCHKVAQHPGHAHPRRMVPPPRCLVIGLGLGLGAGVRACGGRRRRERYCLRFAGGARAPEQDAGVCDRPFCAGNVDFLPCPGGLNARRSIRVPLGPRSIVHILQSPKSHRLGLLS